MYRQLLYSVLFGSLSMTLVLRGGFSTVESGSRLTNRTFWDFCGAVKAIAIPLSPNFQMTCLAQTRVINQSKSIFS